MSEEVQTGCIVRRRPADFHHGLLSPLCAAKGAGMVLACSATMAKLIPPIRVDSPDLRHTSLMADEMEIAKGMLVALHDSSCGHHWGPCPCHVARAVRAIDSAQALEAGCEWHAPGATQPTSFWAKTAKGKH